LLGGIGRSIVLTLVPACDQPEEVIVSEAPLKRCGDSVRGQRKPWLWPRVIYSSVAWVSAHGIPAFQAASQASPDVCGDLRAEAPTLSAELS